MHLSRADQQTVDVDDANDDENEHGGVSKATVIMVPKSHRTIETGAV